MQVQGTASSPPSTAREGYRGWAGEAKARPRASGWTQRRSDGVEAQAPPRTGASRTARCVSEDRSGNAASGVAAARSGGEGGIRTRDGFPRTAFPVRRHSPLGDLSRDERGPAGRDPDRRQSIGHVNAAPRGTVKAKAPPRTGASALEVRERGPEAATHALGVRRGAEMAERAGFEPAVLSHTAFRERHHQPLGHLSAGEDTKRAWSGRPRPSVSARRPAPVSASTSSRRMPLTILIRRGRLGMLRELDDGAGRAVAVVGDRVDERLDVALEERPDAHRAGLLGREDRGVGEPDRAELAGGLAQRDDDGVGGRVVRLADPVVGPGDHRLVDDRHRRARAARRGPAPAWPPRAPRP